MDLPPPKIMDLLEAEVSEDQEAAPLKEAEEKKAREATKGERERARLICQKSKEQLAKDAEAAKAAGMTVQEYRAANERLELFLPDGEYKSFTECGENCFKHLATTGKIFLQDDIVVEINQSQHSFKIKDMSPSMFRSRIDEFFEPKIMGTKGPKNVVVSVDAAKGLLDSKATSHLPNIQTVHNSPVFVEDHGKLRALQ
jgi:hypothetical protein